MPVWVQVLAIIVSLGLLIYMAYRGFSVILLAPVFALLAAAFSGHSGPSLLPAYSELFMYQLANYVKKFFPLFMLGAVFGKVMDDTGMAKAIAHWILQRLGPSRAVISVVLAAAVLTYGGVSLFVVAFAVYPFAAAVFREGNIPKRLIPGAIALGSFTFTMTAIPGTPQIQNMIPIAYFKTTAYAAPWTGTIAALFMFFAGIAWLEWRRKKAMAAGEGYGQHTKAEPDKKFDETALPNPALATLPLLAVLVLNYVLTKAAWDPAIMKPYEKTPLVQALGAVAPTWALILALVAGIVLAIIVGWKAIKDKLAKSLGDGTIGSLLAIMNTASEVGYGNVISSLAGFKSIAAALMAIKGTPLISEAVAVNLLAGITGSASGGMSIALETLGKQYLEWANRVNVSPEVLHRVASIASGGFDSLPHNGAVITLLAIAGLTHKESYIDIGVCTVLIPFTAGILGIIWYSVTGMP